VEAAEPAEHEQTHGPSLATAKLDDAALIDALPGSRLAEARGLAEEAARRGLNAAVPALEALCRRFKGFELRSVVPEQEAALEALAALGGRDAAAAVSRMLATGVVQGPGLSIALDAAARLGCRLPLDSVLIWMRHDEPEVRAAACGCARSSTQGIALLRELTGDLHEDVAAAAALALGRMGRDEARPSLLRMLGNDPTKEIVGAIASVATNDDIVVLGRPAVTRPDLADAVIEALEAIDTPRASVAANTARKRLGR
jgi:HEAT repeat protein